MGNKFNLFLLNVYSMLGFLFDQDLTRRKPHRSPRPVRFSSVTSATQHKYKKMSKFYFPARLELFQLSLKYY